MRQRMLVLLTLFILPFTMQAQLGDLMNRAKNKVKHRIDNKVDNAMDKTLDEAEGKGKKGNNKSSDTGNSKAQDDTQNGSTASLATYTKFDFVPGEKVIYAEDFEKDNIGELPVNWNSNSSGALMTVKDLPGKWLNAINGMYLSGSKAKSFEKNYTIEFDLVLNVTPKSGYYLPSFAFGGLASGTSDNSDNKFLSSPYTNSGFEIRANPSSLDNSAFTLYSFENSKETFRSDRTTVSSFKNTLRTIVHCSINVQGPRIRVWMNDNKVFDIPRAINTTTPINQIFVKVDNSGGFDKENFNYLFSNFKVAAGAPDTRHKFMEEGKFSTTGILFNVNSAVIKPESLGVIKEMATVLKENESVRVKVIGHTSNDGDDAANMALSKQRAAAVKEALVKEFSIDAARIETEGKGETQPVADNKTKEGKMQNRRVEFIKL